MSTVNGKTLLWVDESIASQLKIVSDVAELKEGQIKEIIQKLKNDFTQMEDCMDEDLASFRFHAQKVRNTYKKVVEEEMQATYELWEKMDAVRTETRSKLDRTRELTQTIQGDINQISQSLKNCHIWELNDLIKLIEKVNCMSNQDRELLVQLVELKRQKKV